MYSTTPPQADAKIFLMPSLLKIVQKTLLETPSVKTSTSWFSVFTT